MLPPPHEVVVNIQSILDLPDDPISNIFKFVGRGEFIYIASVCKKFCNIYKFNTFIEQKTINKKIVHDDDNNNDENQNEVMKEKATTVSSPTKDDDDDKTHNHDKTARNNRDQEDEGKINIVPYKKLRSCSNGC